MIALPTVQEIDRLLKEGQLSQRQIAARLGVGRATVGAIASGRRGLHGREAPAPGLASIKSGAQAQRCPQCGHRVYAPCQICLAREHRDLRKKKSAADNATRAQGRTSSRTHRGR
jgi:transcriptional regulator with XRE-family HTH domain